ncbi:UDP-glucose 4-epimerase [Pseudobythopirellula maris]|uniref:UDP-glucose 4-epimerase n=1 Tax=Pseudobythopirellula maris TaxID=2527991 RepID=A0A5C5ZIB6_9BACT|nr:UDP-N-acetylglucosamine 4,6-dehydratase family protein [Pseudobythopirellula maris]TWT87104.1 UDP-glucose 4-epimerase [Pseudobythopirellula maris]
MFEDKTLLVTGGTGSFGNNFIRLALAEHSPSRVIVFSRDEKKQHDMRLALADERLSFVIGDVRDAQRVDSAMRGVDFVFHAAALKQVPSCEFFPIEAVRTNVLGTHNVLEAADRCGVEKLVVLSTDKAVYPINAMGQSKALMEKLTYAKARETGARTKYCAVRYGNVMYSRGSVIPLFISQIKAGKPLTVTAPKMTRLLLPLAEAVRLVTFAMEHGQQGDLFVRKAVSATVEDLATALLKLFATDNPVDVVGVREGEKMHEVLVTAEEIGRSQEYEEYYRVPTEGSHNYESFFTQGKLSAAFAKDGYTSANARLLSVDEIQDLLLELPEVRAELDSWAADKGGDQKVRLAA